MAQPTYPILPGVTENDWRNTIAGFTSGAAPSNAIGVEGNFFIDVSTGSIWGPKSSSAWPGPSVPLNNGANTIIGNTSGSAPSNTIGGNGFYFIDLDTSLVFGPKASGVWPPDGVALGSTANIIWGDSAGGPPDSGIGKTGDYFWDVSTSQWYGPKTTTWPSTPVPVAGGVNAIWGATNGAPDNSIGIVGSFFFDVVQLKWYGPKTTTWPASGGFVFSPEVIDANTITGDAGGSAPSNSIGGDGEYFLDTNNGSVWGPKAVGVWPGSPAFTIPVSTVDGNTITGNSGGVPSNGIGIDGDYFIDTATRIQYGPKATGAWSTPGFLMANTFTGNSSGAAPSNSLGIDGDYFIDTTNGDIYGPKTTGAWPGTPAYTPAAVLLTPTGPFPIGSVCGFLLSTPPAGNIYAGQEYVIVSAGIVGSDLLCTFANYSDGWSTNHGGSSFTIEILAAWSVTLLGGQIWRVLQSLTTSTGEVMVQRVG